MLTRLKGGIIFDPARGVNGKKKDIYIRDGKIVRKPPAQSKIDSTIDINNKIVMAGGIDINTHIGGGKINIARMLVPEDHIENTDNSAKIKRSGSGYFTPTSHLLLIALVIVTQKWDTPVVLNRLCYRSTLVRPIWKWLTHRLSILVHTAYWVMMIFFCR